MVIKTWACVMAAAIGLVAGWSGSASAELLVPVSISDTIVNTSVDDSVFGTFYIGFAFPFFGSVRETVNMSSNGNLQFGTGDRTFVNEPFPYSGFAMIAPFWDDLYLPPGELRYNNSTPGQFVAIWNSVAHYQGLAPNTLEVILLGPSNGFGLADGTIIFSYDTFTSDNSPTVGLNKGDGSTAATLYPLFGSADGVLTSVQAMSLAGRNFAFTPDGNGNYTVSDYTVSAVPEIDPAGMGSILALVSGALCLLERRRLRAA
jgi:hypothetical protein